MSRNQIRKGSKEEWVFNLMSLKANPDTNIVNMTPESSGDKNKFNNGYAILKQMNIVFKLKNGVYLINPQVLPVFTPHHQTVLKHWLEVTSKNY